MTTSGVNDPATIARRLARKAGKLICENLTAHKRIDYKGAVDLVTSVDRECEALIRAGLDKAFPEHAIVAEESGGRAPEAGPCWYVDPLDGTCNFVHGLPHCSVSVALLVDGAPEVAVVYDPSRDELFEARSGTGAHCNRKPLAVSSTPVLDASLLVTGFPYDRRERTTFYLREFEAFLRRARDLRRFGSAALDLCWVACGRFDAFFERGLKPWDTAAGWLIAREAGAQVSDFTGDPYDPWGDTILASNGSIHRECLEVIAGVGERALQADQERARSR